MVCFYIVDVLKCFSKKIKELGIKVKCNTQVEEILVENSQIIGVIAEGTKIKADKIILATGGKSYPLTGSTGDGYELVKKLGHTITKIQPSLVPLESYNKDMCKELQGLSLRNIKIQLEDIEAKKNIYEDFGEMMFTHFGVSGPTILSSSAHLVRYKKIEEKLKNRKIILKIDLKPALTEEKLDERVLRDFRKENNKQFKNSLNKLLPQKLIQPIIKKSSINPNKKVNEIIKEERRRLVKLLKEFIIEIKGFRPIEEAIITSGGINIKEINPKTMESKKIKGLYFAGEIIDVDAYTTGYDAGMTHEGQV